ncbi:Mis12 protein-domain-containing protein [Coniella lustricola]|uniref:Mis12 protein-domain-containing protein n=1 Tax=Coniella lustricola TaxID=2025994 RepID=A0A2T3A670_9PEZI|nr:Mis12 protein-domain-containing protein [Coniella lustricola]
MATGTHDTELLTEHFGYPPVSLIDEIINSINILADKALTSVETGLLNAPPTSIGFGKPPSSSNSANANSKSKRKRKHPGSDGDDGDGNGAPASDLTPEQIQDQANGEIAAGTHQLETLLCTSIDRNFDKFELYVMRNILCVKPEDRDWIRLGHYDGLNFDNLPANALGTHQRSADEAEDNSDDGDKADNSQEDPDIPTIASVNKLRRRLQASQKLNILLAAEKTRNGALLGELRNIAGRTKASAAAAAAAVFVSGASKENTGAIDATATATKTTAPPLAFLHNKGELTQADAATPLTTTTAFALSQMQALRALSTSLSNIMPDLNVSVNSSAASGGAGEEGDAPAAKTTTRKTWRKERVEYIEGAARRHLEAVRGLELGEDGEIRDGEWQGEEGPRVGAEEFAALEGVLDLLNKKGVSSEARGAGRGDAGENGHDNGNGNDDGPATGIKDDGGNEDQEMEGNDAAKKDVVPASRIE